jgi:hypothetical protein
LWSISVDVETELGQAGNTGFDYLTAQRDHQPVIGLRGAAGHRDSMRIRVDRGDRRDDVPDGDGVENVGQWDPGCGQVGLIVADPDVMKWLRADHRDVHGARRHAQLIESTGRAERGPQAGEPRAEYDDVAHSHNTRCAY